MLLKQRQLSNLKEDDYILVRFTTISTEKIHIRQVFKVDEEDQEIHSTPMTRIKSHQAGNTFHFPKLEDTSTHVVGVVLLPQPVCGTTLRTAGHFRFDCERLQRYNIEQDRLAVTLAKNSI